MGQGIYTMIGWGDTNVVFPVKDGYAVELAEVFDSQLAGWLRRDNECSPSYLLLPLAVSDQCLAEYWGQRYLWDLECFGRQAFALHDLNEYLEAQIRAAGMVWLEAIADARKHGMQLGAGSLLLVSDYD